MKRQEAGGLSYRKTRGYAYLPYKEQGLHLLRQPINLESTGENPMQDDLRRTLQDKLLPSNSAPLPPLSQNASREPDYNLAAVRIQIQVGKITPAAKQAVWGVWWALRS